MRSMWVISPIVALALTTSAPAQQGVDQNTKQQIEQIIAAYHDAWNNHNAAGIAGLGCRRIVMRQRHEIIPLGSGEFMSVGAYHLTGSGNNGPTKLDGHWTAVYVPEGGKLKIKMLTAVPDMPPAPTAR